jgi:hypothetical protein
MPEIRGAGSGLDWKVYALVRREAEPGSATK